MVRIGDEDARVMNAWYHVRMTAHQLASKAGVSMTTAREFIKRKKQERDWANKEKARTKREKIQALNFEDNEAKKQEREKERAIKNLEQRQAKEGLRLESILKDPVFQNLSEKDLKDMVKYLNTKMGPSYKEGTVTSKVETDIGEKEATICTNSTTNIKTLDDALAAAKVDLNEWTVDHHLLNAWDVATFTADGIPTTATNYQIKIWLVRKVSQPLFEGLKTLTAELINRGPVCNTPAKPSRCRDPHMLEVSLFDHHFGKLAWAPETDGSSYNVEIASQLFGDAVNDLVAKAKNFNVEKILLPIGSDFFHINNSKNTTCHDTPQDTDGRLPMIFQAGAKALINAIENCLTVAPVEILYVPGNHDRETAFHLVNYISAWFRLHNQVTVDVTPTSRKYARYGVNLIGFTHGDQEKHASLPIIMATERPMDWAETTTREFHTGHFHKKKQMQFVTADSMPGMLVRCLPSLSASDAWHYQKGYVGAGRAAEAYLWSKKNGYTGHFSVNASTLL